MEQYSYCQCLNYLADLCWTQLVLCFVHLPLRLLFIQVSGNTKPQIIGCWETIQGSINMFALLLPSSQAFTSGQYWRQDTKFKWAMLMSPPPSCDLALQVRRRSLQDPRQQNQLSREVWLIGFLLRSFSHPASTIWILYHQVLATSPSKCRPSICIMRGARLQRQPHNGGPINNCLTADRQSCASNPSHKTGMSPSLFPALTVLSVMTANFPRQRFCFPVTLLFHNIQICCSVELRRVIWCQETFFFFQECKMQQQIQCYQDPKWPSRCCLHKTTTNS